MALDSTFYLDTAATAGALREALVRTGVFTAMPDQRGAARAFAPATLVHIAPARGDEAPAEEAGVRARWTLVIVCTDKEMSGAWTENTVIAVLAMLHAFEGDALFLFHDVPALLRKQGVVTLDQRCGLWRDDVEPRVIARVDLAHVWGVVPVT